MRDIKINIENLLIGEKKIITNTDFIISSNKKYGGILRLFSQHKK